MGTAAAVGLREHRSGSRGGVRPTAQGAERASGGYSGHMYGPDLMLIIWSELLPCRGACILAVLEELGCLQVERRAPFEATFDLPLLLPLLLSSPILSSLSSIICPTHTE